jgi:tetratricopeptide (TPR) repeat protein
MRRLLLLVAATLAGIACEASPPVARNQPAPTTIQHDAIAAPPLPPDAETAPLPSNHPRLGDGETRHDEPGALPADHPLVPQQEEAKQLLAKVESMKDELKGKPKSIEVTVALGSLYYDNGKYLDAIDYYRQAIAQGEPLVKGLRAVERVAGEVKPAPQEKAGCARSQLRDSVPLLARANLLAEQGKKAEALACAREAARPVAMAHTRRGNAWYLVGNPAAAVAEHEAALQLFPDEPESLFFRGAIAFDAMGDDLKQLQRAKECWSRFLEVAPDSPRRSAVKEMLPQLDAAIRAGGVSRLPRPARPEVVDGAPGPGPLDPSAQQAVQGLELTPEIVAGFGPILDQAAAQLAKGDVDGARTSIVRVFPFVMSDVQSGAGKVPPPLRARAQALMGLYMQGKGAPMGQVMLQQAATASAESVDAQATALASQGDAAHARTLWKALVESAPDYAAQAHLADKLK